MDIELLSFFLFSLSSLFTLINPVGILPIILSLTENLNSKEYNKIILRGILIASIILLVFAIIGQYIFSFYGITVYACKIAGGILFLKIGINMIEAKVSRTKSTPQESKEASIIDDIALSPIGIPIIAGPGAITSVMLLASESTTMEYKLIFYFSLILTLILSFFILSLGKKLSSKLGTTGLRVIQRIMGLLLMVIAVQFIIDGIDMAVINFIDNNL